MQNLFKQSSWISCTATDFDFNFKVNSTRGFCLFVGLQYSDKTAPATG